MNFNRITRAGQRSVLKLKKHSPQILFYGGLVGTVATTVLASRATLKAAPVLREFKEAREDLDAQASVTTVENEEYTQIVVHQYTWVGAQMVRLYAPAVLVGGLSIAALTKSHRQLTSRNTALTVAYTGLFKTFEAYRQRVRDQVGPEADRQFYLGTTTQVEQIEGKNGKMVEKETTILDRLSSAALTRVFDKNSSAHWCADPGYNPFFLDNQQRQANFILARQGHLFLNEVYDLLGMTHTQEGQVLGWVFEDLGDNDTYVRFGFEDDGEFIAGYTKDALLHFNIHGPILDLIG